MEQLEVLDHTAANLSAKDAIIDLIAGSLGGVALVYVGQPLDTVKVKMQTFPDLYKNMFDCFHKTLVSDGVRRGLYAGTLPAIAANVAENSVLFACYGLCQKFIQRITHVDKPENLGALGNATAGCLAAFFSSFTLCPTELIKCKLQAMRETQTKTSTDGVKKNIGPFQLTKQILKSEGIRGLFRGLTPTIGREMPGYFFFFGGYEATRELLSKPGQCKEDVGLLETMCAGAVGGVIFWTIVFPADVCKSRMQIQTVQSTFFGELVNITRKEGVLALYNGLTPTLVRTVPATAVLFVTYEYSKKFMHYICDDNK